MGEPLIDRALLADALFEARIGIPTDTPILADALLPPLLRLIAERRDESASLSREGLREARCRCSRCAQHDRIAAIGASDD